MPEKGKQETKSPKTIDKTYGTNRKAPSTPAETTKTPSQKPTTKKS